MAGASVAVPITAAAPPSERGHWQLALERFRQHRPALAGIAVLSLLAVLSATVPLISPYDPERTALLLIYEPPSPAHPFGTDGIGRDLATRILFGGRVSLAVGLLAVMYAIPQLFLLIVIGVFFKGMSVGVLIVVLGLLRWMTTSRLVRAQFLSLKHREFVEAARCVGARDRRIIFRHILPNTLAPIIVAATLGIAGAIITESTLSFLGLGIQPPTPSWGNMLKDATSEMDKAPWMAIFPGLFIFLAVVSINFVGDGLRDAFDPRHVIRSQKR
jgi:peptide/nickel transport system permease protein